MSVVVAPATPWGHGALAVVRLSGDGLDGVLARLVEPLSSGMLLPHRARRVRLRDAQGVFDDGVLVVARGPHSYTGEDTAEISCHGNPLIVERLLGAAVSAGARLATAGEFTRRALEHGKLDLVRAEAVLQVSRASSQAGLAIGRAGLDGTLSRRLDAWRIELLDVAAELEAMLDYPGDELAQTSEHDLLAALTRVSDACGALAATWRTGHHLVDGARIALVGAVNAGKSSLFNALVGRSRALVHDTPGTTRDVLELRFSLDGLALTLLDTAGERETDDPIEAAGAALARELVDEADLLVVVLRARAEGPSETERQILARTADRQRVVVCNAVDLPGTVVPEGALPVSAATGHGLETLRVAIRRELVGEEPGQAQLVVASVRQRDLLEQVASLLQDAVEGLPVAGVAVAADLVTEALEELDAMTGADTREDVLDVLFSRFCIGK